MVYARESTTDHAMTTPRQLSQAAEAGKNGDAKAITRRTRDEGTGADDILDQAAVPAAVIAAAKSHFI